MNKIGIILIVLSRLIFSQTGKYVNYDLVDGPGSASGSQLTGKRSLPAHLNKYMNPSISGGRISNVSKHWDFLTNNVDATSNPLGNPLDMALDAAGNLYISLPDLHVIRKVETNGSISTFAGNGNGAWAGDDGPAIDASFNSPHGLHFDAAGNLYIADKGNHIIRKIDTNGVITTVAGQGRYSGFSGDGGAATSAELDSPYDVAFDASGNLYVSEWRRIRKIDTNGIITTFAGDGGDDFSGDGGAATSAGLGNPAHMVLDQFGNLYFADYTHHVVRKIDTNGVITLVYGVGGESGNSSNSPKRLNTPFGVAYEREKIDATGYDEDLLYIMDYHNHVIIQIMLRGKSSGEPQSGNAYVDADILWGKEATSGFDGDGDSNWDETAKFDQIETMITNFTSTSTGSSRIYHITDFQNQRVRKIVEEEVYATQNETSSMSTVAGTDIYNGTNIQANTARIYIPRNSAFDKDGNYYVADQGNHMIRKIDTNGVITTVAGNGTKGFDGDGGAATSAQLSNPRGVTVDSQGNLYISDTGNDRIRKVDTSGNISTFAGTGSGGYSGDGGAATSAQIDFPYQITVDASDNIYFTENNNHVIRKIDVNGNISTVAGNNETGYSGDGGQATDAQLDGPLGVAFDADGNLYIGDSGNHVIRKVDTNGIISTLAGTAQESGFVDGVTGTQARFYTPSTLAIDSKGNLYVTDSSNQRVRKITPEGFVSSIGGNGNRTYSATDSVAATASLAAPYGISIDQNDNIYLSDSWNYVIRKITPRKTTLKVPSEYATIQSAIDYAIQGDTVSVAAGTYKENINLNLKDIHIIGTNRKTTIINGDEKGTVVTFNGDANGNMPDNAYVNTVLAGFTLENGNGTIGGEGTSGGGIEINGKAKPLLKDLIIEYNKALNGAGIKLYNSASPNIENCIIRNNQTIYPDPSGKWSAGMGGGISADDYDGTIKNVVFFGNKSRQASIMSMDWGSANNFEIINCTFANNYGEYNDMYFSGPLTINITNSIIWDDSTIVRNSQWKSMFFSESNGTVTVNAKNSIIQGGYTGDGNIDVNPQFVKVITTGDEESDYHLKDWSPAIGAGTVSGAPTTDIEGNPRPNPAGSNPDMGAFENKWGTPQNSPPVIATQSDQTIAEDGTGTATLSATDIDGDAITYSAVSDTNAVTVSVSSATLTLTPNANWHGVANIKAYASDGSYKDSTSFTLTVTPVQDAPTAFEWVSSDLDTINISKTNLTDTYELKWSESEDVDGDTIDYLVYAKIGVYPAEEVEEITDTTFQLIYEEILEHVFEGRPVNGATVSLNVKATDGIDTVDVTGDNRVIYVNRYDYLSTESEGIPTEFALHENYPNPFNPTTTLRFDLPEVSDITLTIYNMLGQKVKTFNMHRTPAGYHSVKWNATNDLGEQVGAGVYLYQLQTKDFVKTRKMVLLK